MTSFLPPKEDPRVGEGRSSGMTDLLSDFSYATNSSVIPYYRNFWIQIMTKHTHTTSILSLLKNGTEHVFMKKATII